MQTDNFRVVYDILQEGIFSLNGFSIVWLLIVVLFCSLSFYGFWKDGFKVNGFREGLTITLLPIFLFVGIFANVTSFLTQKGCLNDARVGNFEFTEGQIKELKTSSKRESFSVNGVKFEYTEHSSSNCGYAQKKGVLLKNELYVRISHQDGQILKLEIRE